jgi:hypothetical protein
MCIYIYRPRQIKPDGLFHDAASEVGHKQKDEADQSERD